MIKFFRHIRQSLIMENKTGKYFKYAIGEIILVVIGILIALQLNTHKENNEKADLGYKYLTEMRTEVQNDFFYIDRRIRGLQRNIKNHETALSTNNIDTLPLDSIAMILNPENLDFKISELTFNRMKNLGLTALTDNDALNSQINSYYNSYVVSLKLSLEYIFEELRKYLDYFQYQQDAIDYNFLKSAEFEFPALYKQSPEEVSITNRKNSIKFITSIKGRMLILDDLDNKRYALTVLTSFKARTQSLLESIYKELKSKNPEIETLPEFPKNEDFKESPVTTELLKKFVGAYQSNNKVTINILIKNNKIYIGSDKNRDQLEMIYTGEDAFFIKHYYNVVRFNKKNDKIVSFNIITNGEENEFIKIVATNGY